VEHLFCDPEEKDRERLCIPYFADIRDSVKAKYGAVDNYLFDDALRKKIFEETVAEARSYWSVREEFWLEKILPWIGENILFICGHEHAKRFEKLVRSRGYDSALVDEYWKRELFSDYEKIWLR